MKDKINSILSEAKKKISEAVNEGELQSVKSAFIGKQGSLSLLMKELPTLDVSLRPEMGKLLNQAKNQVTELIDEKRIELKLKASEVSPDFDCSVPGILPSGGGLSARQPDQGFVQRAGAQRPAYSAQFLHRIQSPFGPAAPRHTARRTAGFLSGSAAGPLPLQPLQSRGAPAHKPLQSRLLFMSALQRLFVLV